ncbi:MAG: plasmid stabilization protein [Sulfurovum sp.]|nr:plasmid stabilization protein [Sulfurovum sp.]
MKIEKTPRYHRAVKKIIKTHKLTQYEIEETENTFKIYYLDPTLHYKSIRCKKDKYRYSIRVPNTQYRILMTILEDTAYFVSLLNHRDYDKNNKDC